MRALLPAVLLLVLAASGCGAHVNPRLGTGDQRPPQPGAPPDDVWRPAPPGPATAAVEYVCRSGSVPAGWVAIRYSRDGADSCPRSERYDPYRVAVIEDLARKPVGSSMVVCADQPVPRNWVRDTQHDAGRHCQGALVSEGASTVMAIRRIR